MYKTMYEIRNSGVYGKIALEKGKSITFNSETCKNVADFSLYMDSIDRNLGYQANVVDFIVRDVTSMNGKILVSYNQDQNSSIKSHLLQLKEASESQMKKQKATDAVAEKMKTTCSFSDTNLPQDGGKRMLDILSMTHDLYSEKDSFLRYGNDIFSEMRKFGEALDLILNDYGFLVERYNARVRIEDSIKDLWLIFVAISSTLIIFRKDWINTIKNAVDQEIPV